MIIHGTYHGQVPCIIPLRSAISDNAVLLLHTSDVEQPAPVQLTFLPSVLPGAGHVREEVLVSRLGTNK